jgi:hypothetical protein
VSRTYLVKVFWKLVGPYGSFLRSFLIKSGLRS